MARPLRIEYPGAYSHVMDRGLSHRDIFLDNKGRERFLDLVKRGAGFLQGYVSEAGVREPRLYRLDQGEAE